MFNPNSPQARAITDLFFWSMVIGGAIFVLVTGLILYAVWRYRGRPGDGEPYQNPGNRKLEIAWTIAPTVLLSVLFIVTLSAMRTIDPDPVNQEPDIIVTGYSWWWRAEYPKAGFVTANEIHIPVGKQVLFLLKAEDVIHSFWVPELGPKKDMIPGHEPGNTVWLAADEPGVYFGACAEYCGTEHALMRLRVVAMPQAEFDQWQLQQTRNAETPTTEQIALGAQIFQQSTCVNCHAIRGTGATAAAGPDLTHVASRWSLGAGAIENTPENLGQWILNPHAIKPGVQMPGYNYSPPELRALVAYLGSLE